MKAGTAMRVLAFVRESPRSSTEILNHMRAQFRIGAEEIQKMRRAGLIKFDRRIRRWVIP